MAYVPVEDVVMAELFQRLDSQELEQTLYFLKVGGWTVGGMTALAASLATWWETNCAPFLSTDVTLVSIKVTDLSSQFAPTIESPIVPPIAGDQGNDALPNNAAAVVSFRTNSRGRSFRGRNYVAGIPDTSVVNNTLAGTLPTDITTAYQELQDVETAQGCVHVVVSRFSLGAPRVAGLATEVVSYQTDETIRTQRRRLPR